MRDLEATRQERIAGGEDPANVDLSTAEAELAHVLDFFMDHSIEADALHGLLRDLAALSRGAAPSRMLLPRKISHRRPDSPIIENIKGRLAAIMEHRQDAGLTRKQASAWVVRHTTPQMHKILGATSPGAVSAWLQKWGGEIGATLGPGREGYLAMREILRNIKPTEPQMSQLTSSSLSKYLPCQESK